MISKKYIVENSYKGSQGIACAVLVCLGIGLLLQTIGVLLDIIWFQKIGFAAKNLFIPAIGISLAITFKSRSIIVLCAGISSIIGGGAVAISIEGIFYLKMGEPIGAIIASLSAIWIGNRFNSKIKFDMLFIPFIVLICAGIVGLISSELISPILQKISGLLNSMIIYYPVFSSAFISLLFALLILSPASSAALAIAFSLDPVSSAAALIGCSVQFSSFAFLSLKQNSWGIFLGQLICTPKLQTPNIVRSPRIMIIPLILSTLMAPLGIYFFGITSINEIAGLGLCAFVAPLYMLSNQGLLMTLHFLFVSILIPAILCLFIKPIAFKYNWLKKDDLKIEIE